MTSDLEKYKLQNLPIEEDIHKLSNEAHRRAFLETFDNFLSANNDVIDIADSITCESKIDLLWRYNKGSEGTASLMELAASAYDSCNDEFILTIAGIDINRVLIVMDNPYYAKL